MSILSDHKEGLCGCSVESNPNNCVYQSFLDGWEFTPDVGNGSSRGEVFTPRYIVDLMIVEGGLLPEEAVYKYDYSSDKAETYLDNRVLEPAIGTANFTSTIFWHKLKYAVALSESNGSLDEGLLAKNFLRAAVSVYGYDIDAGNLSTTVARLNGEKNKLTSEITRAFWVGKVNDLLVEKNENDVVSDIKQSLLLGEESWGVLLDNDGVAGKVWRGATGTTIPATVSEQLQSVMDNNFQLFSGIDVNDQGTLPGYHNVHWRWWVVGQDASLTFKNVSMREQVLKGQIREVEDSIASLRETRMVDKSEGLFFVQNWASDDDRKKHDQLQKKLAKLYKELG